MAQELHVALIDMSPMLREILHGLLDRQSDMHIVAEYEHLPPLSEPVEREGADVVVFGDGSPRLEDECRELLDAHPRVKLFVVGGDGRMATLYELRPNREPLGEVAPDELLAAMRNAAAGAW